MSNRMRYLALGDSYTIGEGVPQEDSFPYQVVRILNEKGESFEPPQIVAVTGWTTDELKAGIEAAPPQGPFDFVTLLIGVNNQYRGRSLENYRTEFAGLLHVAIRFAQNEHSRVVVLSIPDWGVTPFAEGRDRVQIAEQIDHFNRAAREICTEKAVDFVEITCSTRENGSKDDYLVADGLHPSGKEYAIWAQKVAHIFLDRIERI
ncbi:MAG: SGNH/GDSL hydrolase family protein [Sphingobacteriales bacterium]|nr:MAG: SGNH/GDSL hydrolase family protein [Sphingobacteriales bacterium]